MSTFVYMTRCDGCGHCVDICPSDIMHIDETIRRAKNIALFVEIEILEDSEEGLWVTGIKREQPKHY